MGKTLQPLQHRRVVERGQEDDFSGGLQNQPGLARDREFFLERRTHDGNRFELYFLNGIHNRAHRRLVVQAYRMGGQITADRGAKLRYLVSLATICGFPQVCPKAIDDSVAIGLNQEVSP